MNFKNIRIKDIARLSGVSAGTVDRILHGRGRVSEDARKKVMTVLDQIDYKPNLLARTLASNKKLRIAALVPNPDQDPYWAQSWSGILQAQNDWAPYNIVVEAFLFDLYDRNSFNAIARDAVAAGPQGVLVAPIFHNEVIPLIDRLKQTGIPFVFFNTHIPEVHPLSFIGQNLYQSGRVCAEMMYTRFASHSVNHFAVLHIAEDIHNSVHLAEKEKGFRDFLGEKDSKAVVSTLNINYLTDPALDREMHLLLSDPDLKGILVSTSKATYRVASILESSKRTDVGLAGYDLLEESIPYLERGVIDFLINQNPNRQALAGINHLVNHLLFGKVPPLNDFYPLEIITRENYLSYLAG